MADEKKKPTVCPHCGGNHFTKKLELTIEGNEAVELIQTMAARRNEDESDFIWHLIWLEAGRQGLRAPITENEPNYNPHERHHGGRRPGYRPTKTKE